MKKHIVKKKISNQIKDAYYRTILYLNNYKNVCPKIAVFKR